MNITYANKGGNIRDHFRICGKKLCLGRGICDDDADHAVVYCK